MPFHKNKTAYLVQIQETDTVKTAAVPRCSTRELRTFVISTLRVFDVFQNNVAADWSKLPVTGTQLRTYTCF